jgi:hypothetical protein
VVDEQAAHFFFFFPIRKMLMHSHSPVPCATYSPHTPLLLALLAGEEGSVKD